MGSNPIQDWIFFRLKGDSSVLHCSSLLCTILASLAHAYERVHIQNILRDFPQAKLYSEINARFLLNKHSDPYFLMHECKLHKVIYNISRFEEKFKILHKNIVILLPKRIVLGMCPHREFSSL